MRRVLMFLNPLLINTARRRATVEQIAELLSTRGSDVHLQETLSAQSAGDQAREAVAAGFDTVLVCGGDGTIFQVLQGVAGSSASLGVLPFGTGNVIAQNLSLPRNPLAAAQLLVDSTPRAVSLGQITVSPPGHGRNRSWYFFIAAGMGVHAALMNLAPTGQGKRRGGRLAYFVGGARLLIEHPVRAFEIEMRLLDGTTTRENACEAIATHVSEINRWRPGGDPFAPWLRVAWVPPTSRFGLAHASFHALATRQANGEFGWAGLPFPRYVTVERLVCRALRNPSSGAPLLVEADGEVLGASWTEIKMASRRLNLLWPNTAASS